jgi:hypothetical protein
MLRRSTCILATIWIIACGLAQALAETLPAQPPASNAPAAFTLDIAATGQTTPTLAVPSPSRVALKIIRSGRAPTGKAMLDLAPFTSEQGVVQRFTVSLGDAAAQGGDHIADIAMDEPVITANLNVPGNLPTGTYSGNLILTPPDNQAPTVWRVVVKTVNLVRPAVLVLDRNTAPATSVRPAFCLGGSCLGGEPATVTVRVRDKTGTQPLSKVMVRLEAPTGTAATEQPKIVAMTFNGRDVGDLFAAPTVNARDVAIGEQGVVALTFDRALEPGEYTVPLRFTAANSGDDDLQRLTITIKARDSVFWAVVVLLLAAVLSFLATRVVSMMRQRASFLIRVHAMRPAWLAQEPQIVALIGLRATLRQAEDLSRRFWLTGQKEIDARLTAAGKLLAILDRIRQIRSRINMIADEMVRQRAGWKLHEIAEGLDPTPLSDADVTRLNAQLDAFDDWCASGSTKQEDVYWAEVEACIKAAIAEVKPFDDADAQRLADTLKGMLPGSKPATLGLMSDADVIYRRLIILWGVRGHTDWLRHIVQAHPIPPANWPLIEDVYRVIDEGWWDILKDARATHCRVEGPPAAFDELEAYDTVMFTLDVTTQNEADQALRESFLLRNKLTYLWTFTNTVGGKTRSWPVRSAQPQVAQYSPAKGQLAVADVQVAYRGQPGPSVQPSAQVAIDASSDFRVWRITEQADIISFIIALAVSVFSGVKLYALGVTFGSLSDYTALFTWGAGVDQGKNFLQSLAVYSSDTPTQPATGTQSH